MFMSLAAVLMVLNIVNRFSITLRAACHSQVAFHASASHAPAVAQCLEPTAQRRAEYSNTYSESHNDRLEAQAPEFTSDNSVGLVLSNAVHVSSPIRPLAMTRNLYEILT
jgi:hypothetical protein